MTFGDFADWCSVAGLVVTFILANGAWQVKKRLERVDLYPEIIDDLVKHADRLSDYVGLGDLQQIPELNKIIGSLHGCLRSVLPLVSGQTKKSVSATIDLLESYNDNKDIKHLMRLSNAVYRLHTQMIYVMKGLKY